MKSTLENLQEKIQRAPALLWVALGILPPFIPFLLAPVFFRPELRIRYPNGYLPKLIPIGNDLRLSIFSAQAWLERREYTDFIFTPLATFFFAPFTKMEYAVAYRLMTLLTVAAYALLVTLALLLTAEKNHAVAVLVAAFSLFSYGVQFELERGQSHSIALALCLWAAYLFHRAPRWRLAAYALFILAVQLKFYPAIFILLFVEDWRAWKTNLLRMGALGLLNVAALFLFGWEYFLRFYHHLLGGVSQGELAPGNHSIASFAFVASHADGFSLLASRSAAIETALYLFFLFAAALILFNNIRRNHAGLNPDLLMVCVAGSLTLPSVNHDYSLPLLTLPFILLVAQWQQGEYRWGKTVTALWMVFSSLAYALTLFPPNFKPAVLDNALPAIFILLAAAVFFNLASSGKR